MAQSYAGDRKSRRSHLALIISLSLILFSVSSCSWVKSRRSLFGDDEDEVVELTSPEQKQQYVPKQQYDQLLQKYEAVMKEKHGEAAPTEGLNMAGTTSASEAVDLVDSIKGVKTGKEELAETVDVFSNNSNQASASGVPGPILMSGMPVSEAAVEKDINQIRTAIALVNQNKFTEALNLLKELEKSPVKQVNVRAKFYLGEMLFKQGEYDLAMQVFEDLIKKQSFSGIVLKTLGRLIVCAEKLKLSKKQETYYSILHDFFEAV